MTEDLGSPPLTLDTAGSTGGSWRQAGLLPAGPLEGEVRDGHACFWFPVESGEAVSLVWPEGLTAKDSPLRIEDSDGRIVAQVGDTVTEMVGGNISDGRGCRERSRQWILHVDTFTRSEDFWHA